MSDFRLAAVDAKCRELLRELDLEETSERKIRELLSKDLGFDVEEYKGLISSIVDEFMSQQPPENIAPNSAEPLAKKQRVVVETNEKKSEEDLRSKWEGPPPAAAAAPAPVKKEAQAPPQRGAVNDSSEEEAEKKLKGALETIFDVLEDYGANGTTAKTIAEATKMDKSEVNRVLYVCLKRGMDLRLTHDGGKTPPTWALDVTKEKGNGGVASAPAGSAVMQPQQQQQQQQQIQQIQQIQQLQQQAEDAVDGEVCRLSNAKRIAVQVFKGAPTISFREYYEKNGKWLPGKKGINLNAEQFENLREKIADVEIKIDVVAAGNGSESETVCEVGANKRVTVSKYNGKPMVHIREYYQNKSGEWAPGFKGLALLREQWEMFVNHADAISAKVETM